MVFCFFITFLKLKLKFSKKKWKPKCLEKTKGKILVTAIFCSSHSYTHVYYTSHE